MEVCCWDGAHWQPHGPSSVFRNWLGAAGLTENLDDVTVESAFCVIKSLLAVLICGVDLCTAVDEHLNALQLLLHRRPHQCCLAAFSVGLQRAPFLDKDFAEERVPGLHCSKEPCLSIRVLVVNLGALGNQVLANFIASKLGCEQKRGLSHFGDQVHLCILVDQTLHRGEVSLCSSPHQGSLVLIVELIHLRTLLDE